MLPVVYGNAVTAEGRRRGTENRGQEADSIEYRSQNSGVRSKKAEGMGAEQRAYRKV